MNDPRQASTTLPRTTLVRWRIAIFAIFAVSGLSLATWASRIPAIKDTLDVSRTDIGFLLLIGGVMSIVGLSISGMLLTRFGARWGMLVGLIVAGGGLALVGVGTEVLGSFAVTCVGLGIWGLGMGTVDVMMNVEAAAIEQHSGRTLLPLFHAMFSGGTVLGASFGVAAISLGIGVFPHLAAVAVVVVVSVLVCAVYVPAHVLDEPVLSAGPPLENASPTSAQRRRRRRDRLVGALSAWREPRTYALGVVMLGMAFAEGGANDWLPLAVVEGHHSTEEMGAIALTVFSVSMALGRIVGGPVVDRVGRVAVLRILAATAATGLLLFILAPNLPVLFIGAALWGLGASLGFPLGMSAAADDPEHAASRVAAAATIGYVAFLVGPPVLGFISEQIGLLPTLGIIVVLIVASGLFSSAARPLSTSHVGGHT